MSLKHELQDIISGNGSVRHGKAIRAIADYLGGKKKAISGAEKGEFLKEKETQVLIEFVEGNSLWYKEPEDSRYIGEGAEQEIYEHSNPDYVIKFKLGDAASAMAQIKAKGYHQQYLGSRKKIILLGIGFDVATRNVGDYLVEEI